MKIKRIIFSFLIFLIPAMSWGQRSTWNIESWIRVNDTTAVDKHVGFAYIYDGQYWLGTGTYLKAVPIAKTGTAGQILYTDGSGNYYWGAPANASWYGVSWDERTDTYTRLGTLKDSLASAKIADADLPIQSAMRRCLLKNDGTVYKYLRSDNSNYYEDGSPANLNGPYQVMVEIPKFYYYFHFDPIDSIFTWKISLDSLAGFQRHPAFIKNGAYVDYRYIGAYEATVYSVAAGRYVNGLYLPTTTNYKFAFIDGGTNPDTIKCVAGLAAALTHPFSLLVAGDSLVISGTTNNNYTTAVVSEIDSEVVVPTATVVAETSSATIHTQIDWTADTLASISGKAPMIYGTRANFRTVAALRGSGWRIQDFDLISAVQLLYLVEYANFNSQAKIGNGLTDWATAWSGWNDYNPIEKSGDSNTKGNGTYNVSGGDGVTGSYMSYRGIENIYGHLWQYVDGFNINNHLAYISNTEPFVDGVSTGYDLIGTLAATNGYQRYLYPTEYAFLPDSIGGVGVTSYTYITDYYYQDIGWRVARLGGGAADGVGAGFFDWHLSSTSGALGQRVSSRISY